MHGYMRSVLLFAIILSSSMFWSSKFFKSLACFERIREGPLRSPGLGGCTWGLGWFEVFSGLTVYCSGFSNSGDSPRFWALDIRRNCLGFLLVSSCFGNWVRASGSLRLDVLVDGQKDMPKIAPVWALADLFSDFRIASGGRTVFGSAFFRCCC